MGLNQDRREWKAHVAPQLYPTLREEPEEYRARVERGVTRARSFLAEQQRVEGAQPSSSTLREAHRIAFCEVTPDAGHFRRDEIGSLLVGRDGELKMFAGSMSASIEKDLAGHRNESRLLLEDAKSSQEKAAAIGFYHAKLQAIRPFSLGSELVARAVLCAQAEHELCRFTPLLQPFNREAYDLGLVHARERNDLSLLVACTLDVDLEQQHRVSPIRVEVWPQVVQRDLPNGQTIAYEAQDPKEAIARVRNEVVSYLERFGSERAVLRIGESARYATLELADSCREELLAATRKGPDRTLGLSSDP